VKDYPDTSFVLSLYLQDVHSPKAAAHLAGRNRPLAVSALLAFEVEQAIDRAMFRRTLAPAQGHKALSDWQADLASGAVEIVGTDWPQAYEEARRIARLRTVTEGYRSLDILHVAAALVSEAEELLTFDERQRKLAQAEGLKVKP
jgi:predicted nucleic acid-binding protein